MVFYAATKTLALLATKQLAVLFVHLSYNVNLQQQLCHSYIVCIYFLVKKKRWSGEEKNKLNTTSPTPYSLLIPHTNVVTQQKITATKNVAFTHYSYLSHITYSTSKKTNAKKRNYTHKTYMF